MKKLYFILLLFGSFCCSCTIKNSDFIYQAGREWIFSVYFYNADQELIDTIEVKMESKRFNRLSFFSGQKGLNYEYAGIKEKAGFIEDERHVFLHPPRMGLFDFAEIPPMPQVNLPPHLITEAAIELKIVAGFKELDGLTISQKRQQKNETEDFNYKGSQLFCYRIEGMNTSHLEELGQYKVTYLFNEQFGFVRFLYEKPGGSIVDMQLKETNFD